MTTSTIVILVAIALYMCGMVGIGIWKSKTNKNTDDFYLGGRRLGPIVTAMSAEASDMSSWLLMGLPGVAMLTGLAEASWTAIGLAIGTYINWLIVAKRIRIYTGKFNAITIPEFFSKRFGDNKNILSLFAALFIIVFFIPYTASGFSACGKLFSSVLGVDYMTAMLICAAVIAIYCILGGFLAASTTDLIQSIVMTIALVFVIGYAEIACTASSGMFGFEGVLDSVKDVPGFMSLTKIFNPETGAADNYSALTIASLLAWGLGYFGMPHVLLRFMAIEDPKKLKTSRRIASVWVVISMTVAIFIGVAGYALVKHGAIPALADTETIIIEIAKLIGEYGYILALVGGVILAGILAATMSTADSQLIAASSGVTQDICKNFFKINLSNKALMWVARISVIAISVIAVFLARDPDSSVFRIVSFAWAGFGAAFGPVVLAALFWKRANNWGALAGMISGAAMVFIWKYLIAPIGGVFAIYELLPAFIVGCIFLVVVSLITGKPSDDVVNGYEEAKAACKE
ncbi:MAG: sodium/proline symporter PutP [Clostridia bacterium]|nr:sodium/proline symporter PutP [Clostridia bacterium]